MSNLEEVPERIRELIDEYLDDCLEATGLADLEAFLQDNEAARTYFVRYAQLHTDLHIEGRARRAAERGLERIGELRQTCPSTDTCPPWRPLSYSRRLTSVKWWLVAAALLLLAFGASVLLVENLNSKGTTQTAASVAWLVNAQNCTWSDGGPTGGMQVGEVVRIERGLAEIQFQCGARVVLQGPADLEFLSDKSARLLRGKLTARVPEPAIGFEILSPQGKVIDLGTEFGIVVLDNGSSDVYVFEGKVEAHSDADGRQGPGGVSLVQNQSAHIAAGNVMLKPAEPGAADSFVRAIVPPPVVRPRTLQLGFDKSVSEGVLDTNGLSTGLTHRLPGTGAWLPEHDDHLRVDRTNGQLELTTTNSDINTQLKLNQGEYPGLRLCDLGFTGKEDFAITTTILNIPALDFVGQFGLFAGTRSDENIRGGLISIEPKKPGQYKQFLVNDHKGIDADLCEVGLLSTGTDLRLTLKRVSGKYALSVENLTDGSASTVTIHHPEFLDNERDLYVGLFAANPRSDVQKTLIIKKVSVTVWTVSPASDAGRSN